MLELRLARRQRRNEIAALQWTAALFALPGILVAAYELPVALNTVDGYALFGQGAAAGAGLGAGLTFALRGFWKNARAEWFGFVLCLLLTGGAVATHANADQPEAERTLVASHVVDQWNGHGRLSERALWLRSVVVDWQSRPLRIVAGRDLSLRAGSAVVLSVYEGRFGHPVIERVQRAH